MRQIPGMNLINIILVGLIDVNSKVTLCCASTLVFFFVKWVLQHTYRHVRGKEVVGHMQIIKKWLVACGHTYGSTAKAAILDV